MALPAVAPAKTRTITCKLKLFATIPQPAPTAANFGTTNCGKPFGFGVQKDSSTVTRSSLTTGVFEGPFKMFFDTGTIKGRFRISFVTTLAAAGRAGPLPTIAGVVYTGTVSVTGGTGAWRRIRGSGTVTGHEPRREGDEPDRDAARCAAFAERSRAAAPAPRADPRCVQRSRNG